MEGGRRPFHLVRNSLFAGMTGASNILFLVLFLVAARYLGAESLGVVALGMAVGSAVAFGLNLGLNSVAIRRIATEPATAAATAAQLLLCRLGISVVGIAVLVPVVSITVHDPLQRSMILLFSISGVLRSINMSSRALLQAIDRFSWESAVVFVDAAAILVFGYLVLHLGGGEVGLAQVFVAVRAVIAAAYLLITPQLFQGVRWRFDMRLSWWLVRTGFPLGVATALSSLYWQMDILMISAWSTALATGIFSAAFRIVDGLRMLPDTLGSAFYPRLATSAAGDLPGFDDVFARGCRYLMVAGAAAGVAMAAFGPRIIELLYGDSFADAGEILVAMAALPVMLYFGTFAFVGLRALGRESLVMVVMLLAVGAKLVLGFLLVRGYGMEGATVTTIGGTIVLFAAVLVCVWRARASMLGLPRVMACLLPCAGVSIAAGLLLQRYSLILAIAAATLLFAAGLLWLRVFDAAELAWLRRMLRVLPGR